MTAWTETSSAAVLDRLPDARLASPRPRTSCRRRTCAAPRADDAGRERARVHDHGHDAPGDRRPALRPRAPRDLRGRVAARAAGRARGARGSSRPSESVSLALLVLLERLSPVERAVLRPARVLRLRVRRDRRDRRTPRGQLPPDPHPCPPARRRRPPALRRRPGERRTLAARFLAAAREGDLDGPRRPARPGRGPGRRRRRPRPRDPAPDGRRPRRRPRDGRVLRPDRRAGRDARARSGQRRSRASARSTPRARSSTSSPSTSSTAAIPRSTRSLNPESSPTSAPLHVALRPSAALRRSPVCFERGSTQPAQRARKREPRYAVRGRHPEAGRGPRCPGAARRSPPRAALRVPARAVGSKNGCIATSSGARSGPRRSRPRERAPSMTSAPSSAVTVAPSRAATGATASGSCHGNAGVRPARGHDAPGEDVDHVADRPLRDPGARHELNQ